MKRFLLLCSVFLLCFAGMIEAQPTEGDFQVTVRLPLLLADGFGFQGKEYKVVKLAVTGEFKEKEQNENAKPTKLGGILEIAGFAFKIKPVLTGEDNLEADLMELSDPISDMEQEGGKKLDVPVGHISIKAHNPDPKNRVYVGDLRISSEKAEGIKGTFELYLNDHTPKKMSKPGSDSLPRVQEK